MVGKALPWVTSLVAVDDIQLPDIEHSGIEILRCSRWDSLHASNLLVLLALCSSRPSKSCKIWRKSSTIFDNVHYDVSSRNSSDTNNRIFDKVDSDQTCILRSQWIFQKKKNQSLKLKSLIHARTCVHRNWHAIADGNLGTSKTYA